MGDDWNSFVQSRPVRILLYTICTCCCAFYGIGAVRDLIHPENSAGLIETMGSTGFYVMTGVRVVVMAWVTVAFARMVVKAIRDEDQ